MRILLSAGLLAVGAGFSALAFAQQPPAAPAQPPPPPPAVKVGEPAPDFTLPYLASTQEPGKVDRKEVKLSAFKGKKNVVLAFFVAAFSPG